MSVTGSLNALRASTCRGSTPTPEGIVATCLTLASKPLEQRADGRHVRLQRSTRKRQTVECTSGSGLVSRAARVRDDDGNVPEVHRVTHSGLDANLERDTDDHEGNDAAVAQCDVE